MAKQARAKTAAPVEPAPAITTPVVANSEQSALELYRAGKHAEALEMAIPLVAQSPGRYDLWNFVGVLYRLANRLGEAQTAYRKAIALEPKFAETYNNLANVLREQGELEAAVAAYRQAIALNKDFVSAYSNLGGVLRDLGQLDDAMTCLKKAMELRPGEPDMHWDYALTLLKAARYPEGFAEYESRWARKQPAPPDFSQPAWHGEPVPGKTLFIYTEQGLGDFLQYLRFLPAALARAERVVMDVFPVMAPVIPSHPRLTLVERGGPLPQFDTHCALMSLPHILRYDMKDVMTERPYANPPAATIARWQARLGPANRLRIGVVWAGNPNNKADHIRSLPLAALMPLFERNDADYFLVQMGHGRRELKDIQLPSNVTDLGGEITNFGDTASIMRLIDVMITPCTSTAHLAGALCVPTWVLLSEPVDWRWLMNRDDSPWYSSARLFRQTIRGDWGGVVKQVGRALDQRLSSGPTRKQPQSLNTALVTLQSGKVDVAAGLLDQILLEEPNCAPAWTLRGIVYAHGGRSSQAEQAYRHAIALVPNDADAWLNLAHSLRGQKRLDDAISAYRHVAEYRSDLVEPWIFLSDVLRDRGDFSGAVDAGKRATELGAHLTASWNNLGAALAMKGDAREAVAAFRRGLELDPNSAACLLNTVSQLEKLALTNEAIDMAERAVKALPKDGSARRALARNLRNAGRIDEARTALETWLEQQPNDNEAKQIIAAICNDQGTTQFKLGEHEASLASMREAVRWHQEWPIAHYNLALLLLQTGQYTEGWQEFEWRLKLPHIPPHALQRPIWDGSPLKGKTVLVHWEQGFGDTLQFLRFGPLLAARGARILLEVQAPMKALCAGLTWASQVLTIGEAYPDGIDYKISLLSLPHRLGVTFDNLPNTTPYFTPAKDRVAEWKKRLGTRNQRRVGLIWAGSPTNATEHARAPGLEAITKLWKLKNVDFVILQKGFGRKALEGVTLPKNVIDFGESLEDFADTAAVMSLLDAVISTDTSTAHVAGALGLPLWVPLHATADWRWVEKNGRCRWYPTAKLFRQGSPEDWQGPVQALYEHMESWLKEKPGKQR